jgi:hypothetical protein
VRGRHFGAACPLWLDTGLLSARAALAADWVILKADCKALRLVAPALLGAFYRHGHQITRQALRHLGPHSGGTRRRGAPRGRQARLRRLEQTDAGLQGPAQPSPTLGDALNAGYTYLEVRCLGCDTHQTVALDIVRRPRATPTMSWSDTCDARIARRCEAIHTSAAIWSRYGARRFRRVIRHLGGGRGRGSSV